MKALKSDRYKQAVRDGTLHKLTWVVVNREDPVKISFFQWIRNLFKT